ncbi:putative sensor histidine kinase/response regulator [Aspergillus candidus]|uniref:GAF domain-like protein n=1 Tax=Aspergillus candidus TaxID=41067 RepID=A0A2I2EZE7_ASPCN|nr:GAF domain-like protein [Aspergillus candidus]PLB33754.1 GAF domain-like protein [Aspergillus candidus]
MQSKPDNAPPMGHPPSNADLPSRTSGDGRVDHHPPLKVEPPDRVYPVRSMVSVEPSPSNQHPPPGGYTEASSPGKGAQTYPIIDSRTWDEMRSRSQSRKSSRGSVSSNAAVRTAVSPLSPLSATESASPIVEKGDPLQANDGEVLPSDLITSRFKHVLTEGGHAVLTGRANESFQECEDEPIRTPGAVQSFGVLVALKEEPDDVLSVRVVSENSEGILGHSPNSLFAMRSFCDILSDEQADTLLDHVAYVREEGFDAETDGPDVFILTINKPTGPSVRLWCAVHVNHVNPDIVICEFELEDDRLNPPSHSTSSSPGPPVDTSRADPTPEQLAESTVDISQPLRILRNSRRRRGETASMEVFNIISQIQDQLARAQTIDSMLNITVGIVRALTGFHRILVYQFDNDWNGYVVSELLDPKHSRDFYKGLHFPASDIPKQARDLYRINRVRLLYDRDQQTARLVCRTLEDLERPLDMTYTYLRAMSPIHLKYLAHMGVRASMSISINSPSSLWGLISCHSYGTAMRVTFPIRKICRLIGDTVSHNIDRLSYTSKLQARNLINTMPMSADTSGYIVASPDDLLKLFDADYGALCIHGETKLLGGNVNTKLTHSQEILALLEYLKMRRFNSVLASHNIKRDFADLRYLPGFKVVSGMLYVPLSTDGGDFMAFFRRGQLTEIKWGGNPYEKQIGHGHLEPRASFKVWTEMVLDQSREWTSSEIETAALLCLVYGKFIRVRKQKQTAMQGSHLTKILLANSAHEFRTPLNAVMNYLEIALEGALDTETRENLSKSYSASKSLIYVINDLLDLTNTEKGNELNTDEPFDIAAVFHEATSMFETETKRKGLQYTVVAHPSLPKTVTGDERRVRQTISNLISNAVQNTSTGGVTVEIWRCPDLQEPGKTTIFISVLDTGTGMSQDILETLFQELEQVSPAREEIIEGDDDQESLRALMDPQDQRVLGLGLALVSRVVHNSRGQLRVRSEEGKGSRFQISLEFTVAEENTDPVTVSQAAPSAESIDSPSPLHGSDEFLLVDGEQSRRPSATDDLSPRKTSPPSTEEPAPTPEQALTSHPEPPKPPEPSAPTTLRVLVAEDDPINGKILEKRLNKSGHTVRLTVNGEECAAVYREDPTQYDAILMDIQMPIVDGITCTKIIRDFKPDSSKVPLSDAAQHNGRVPIFAVSASLSEKDAPMYMETGFDGWIMKPINFTRLNVLLDALQHPDVRREVVYSPGHSWEEGGWFTAPT